MTVARADFNRLAGETPCDWVDRMPGGIRALVHDYGLSVVVALVQSGVTDPVKVRHIMRAVTLGAREPGNKRMGTSSPGGDLLRTVDAWLVRNGHAVTAREIVRVIRDGGLTVLPTSPGAVAIEASVGLDLGPRRLSASEKHQRRMTAARRAEDRALWGDL